MKNKLFLITLLLLRSLVGAQTSPIKLNELDWNFSNNELNDCFRKILSNNDVLLLAETDHGHGSSLIAQAKILKGLIDSNKISDLYIESNRINCDKITTILKEQGTRAILEAEKYFNTSELIYWKKIGFWNFLADHIANGKLKLKGIDIDGISPKIMKELYEEALSLKTVRNLASSDSLMMVQKINPVIGNSFSGWQRGSMFYWSDYIDLEKFVNMVCEEYTQMGNSQRVWQWKCVLRFFYWMVRRAEPLKDNFYVNQIENIKQNTSFNSVRDSFMAVNFFEQYRKGEKATVSLSAYHALKKSFLIEGFEKCCKDISTKTMGEYLDKTLGNSVYSVCFPTASGTYGILRHEQLKAFSIKKPKRKSLELDLYKDNVEYCFIDFSSDKEWNNKSFEMNVIFYKYRKSVWGLNYSSVFFIRRMEPMKLF